MKRITQRKRAKTNKQKNDRQSFYKDVCFTSLLSSALQCNMLFFEAALDLKVLKGRMKTF